MKKVTTFILILLSAVLSGSAAESADALLKSAAARLRAAGSMVVTCRISGKSESTNASLTFSGNKFVIKSSDMEIWYDGKNQWAYSPRTEEVSLTEPTSEELSQTNPLSMLDYFAANFTAEMLPATKGMKNIRLTAKSKRSDISTVNLSLNSATLEPAVIKVRLSSGEQFTVTVTSLRQGKALPASFFTYHRNLHPNAEIIDLR